jgi:hypothetical protein
VSISPMWKSSASTARTMADLSQIISTPALWGSQCPGLRGVNGPPSCEQALLHTSADAKDQMGSASAALSARQDPQPRASCHLQAMVSRPSAKGGSGESGMTPTSSMFSSGSGRRVITHRGLVPQCPNPHPWRLSMSADALHH